MGCGCGAFLASLVQSGCFEGQLLVDLVDPSSEALTLAQQRLRPPARVGEKIVSRAQDLGHQAEHDLVLAVHSLYALSKARARAAACD